MLKGAYVASKIMLCRNGEEWNSMRKAIQAVLMRPQDVSDYLPSVNEVADDVIKAIGDNMDSNGTITHFNNLAGRWNMESKLDRQNAWNSMINK